MLREINDVDHTCDANGDAVEPQGFFEFGGGVVFENAKKRHLGFCTPLGRWRSQKRQKGQQT